MLSFLTFRFYDLIYRQILLQKQLLNKSLTTMAMAASIVDIFQNVNNICITFVILKQLFFRLSNSLTNFCAYYKRNYGILKYLSLRKSYFVSNSKLRSSLFCISPLFIITCKSTFDYFELC